MEIVILGTVEGRKRKGRLCWTLEEYTGPGLEVVGCKRLVKQRFTSEGLWKSCPYADPCARLTRTD